MQFFVNILVLASFYALICSGYVLVYQVSRVLNLAHGELMLLGAYLLLSTAWLFSGLPLIALLVALVFVLVIGVCVYLFLMRFMTGEQVFAAVLVTVALGILLRGLMVLIWTAQIRHPLEALGWNNSSIPLIGGAFVSRFGLSAFLLTIMVYASLFVFFRHSRWGIRMRAAGENPLLASQRGIELHTIFTITWGIAVLTGGMAGMLLALDSGLDDSLVMIGFKAFPVALVGGLDSLKGSIFGALIVASAEVAAIRFIDPLLSDVVPFIVLIAFLMVRPWGLFGSQEELERV